MLAADYRKVIGDLVAVGIVSPAVGIADGEANPGDARFSGRELSVVVPRYAEFADSERVHVEG